MLKAREAEIGALLPSKFGDGKGKQGGVDHGTAVCLRSYRQRRYQMVSMARPVLQVDAAKRLRALNMHATPGSAKKYAGDIHRTIDCMRVLRGSHVAVNRHIQFGTASYAGLVTCGSVWACAVCAAKVQERRRVEVEQGVLWHQGNGGEVVMVTFTFPHHRGQLLGDLLAMQADAFTRMRKTRRYRDLLQGVGYLGLIRSLEVVHGDNGWHPHTHELWFVNEGTCAVWLRSELSKLWMVACHRAGLIETDDPQDNRAFLNYSVDVRGDVDSGDYIAKQADSRRWGIAAEVTKSSSKGRGSGIHPHALLLRDTDEGDALFLEYINGMKGKRQLHWSRGLKAAAGLVDVSDEELADQEESGAVLLSLIPRETWRYVVGNDARAELLDAAEVGGYSGICDFLRGLGVPESGMPSRGDRHEHEQETRDPDDELPEQGQAVALPDHCRRPVEAPRRPRRYADCVHHALDALGGEGQGAGDGALLSDLRVAAGVQAPRRPDKKAWRSRPG